MHNDAIFGQELDIAAATPDPERVYALKTASYTVQGPLAMGALLASAPRSLLSLLERFAQPAGIAFQLRDDLLGAFGRPETTGKPHGADLSAGKFTLLVKLGLARSRHRDRAVLRRVIGNTSATSLELEQALGVLERSGARAAVERRITELSQQARAELQGRAITPEGRELLEGAVQALAERPA
jgi:geranylgeranyl diphosphate synthase, type I